jgi:hypothetical protein
MKQAVFSSREKKLTEKGTGGKEVRNATCGK